MPACVSISKRLTLLLCTLFLASAPVARAVDPPPPVSAGGASGGDSGGSGGGRTVQPEEDDYRQTPYTSYGEFNDEDEAEDTKFFQYGRFFGVSLGLGYEGATGNRGSLYTGGLPAFSLRVHYWFDFNFALTLGIYSASHQYTGFKGTSGSSNAQKNDVSIFEFGSELRYYFDTRDATAPVTFAGPFLLVGVGSYQKSESDISAPDSVDKHSALGLSFGGGLEFPLKPRKAYLDLETKFHAVNFEGDSLAVTTSTGKTVKDSSGMLFTILASILFTY
ncbi:MAG: outer membrane beta-barrel protein [Bdellovibrionales bacterium]|nr:outer membrane beta-barrel protein [Bdellovibrionales bacterium]